MKAKAISADEKRWEAEDDARSLERYAEISGNKSRMTAASKILKEKAAATNKALGLTGSKPTASKPSAPKPKPPAKKNTDNIRNAMMSGMSKGKK
jgi:hypothetical protein